MTSAASGSGDNSPTYDFDAIMGAENRDEVLSEIKEGNLSDLSEKFTVDYDYEHDYAALNADYIAQTTQYPNPRDSKLTNKKVVNFTDKIETKEFDRSKPIQKKETQNISKLKTTVRKIRAFRHGKELKTTTPLLPSIKKSNKNLSTREEVLPEEIQKSDEKLSTREGVSTEKIQKSDKKLSTRERVGLRGKKESKTFKEERKKVHEDLEPPRLSEEQKNENIGIDKYFLEAVKGHSCNDLQKTILNEHLGTVIDTLIKQNVSTDKITPKRIKNEMYKHLKKNNKREDPFTKEDWKEEKSTFFFDHIRKEDYIENQKDYADGIWKKDEEREIKWQVFPTEATKGSKEGSKKSKLDEIKQVISDTCDKTGLLDSIKEEVGKWTKEG